MSDRALAWRHITINTLGTWLHGDPRGFRSRGHRIHSSGDYSNPPPHGEHHALHVFHSLRSRDEVHLPREARPLVGRALIQHFRDERRRIVLVAVDKVHAHIVVELPDDVAMVKAIVGHVKRKSSRAIKHLLPGSIWAAGGLYKRVVGRAHLLRLHDYVLFEQGAGAWTWCYRDEDLEGKFARMRERNPGRRFALPRREGE